MKTVNHSIFRDLVPGYIENLTSEDTNRQMEKHMEHCDNCRKYLKEMQDDLFLESVSEQRKEERNIDFLKTVKSKNRKKIFTIVTSLTSIFLILILGYYLMFVRMWIADENDVQKTIKHQGTDVTLSFKSKNENRHLLIKKDELDQGYVGSIIVYEQRDDFSTPSVLKDETNITYTFLDENTLLLGDDKQQKLTGREKIYIQYKDGIDEITLSDLYKPDDKKSNMHKD